MYFIDINGQVYNIGKVLGSGAAGEASEIYPITNEKRQNYILPIGSFEPGLQKNTFLIPKGYFIDNSSKKVLKRFKKQGLSNYSQEAQGGAKLYNGANPKAIGKYVITELMEGHTLKDIPRGYDYKKWSFQNRIDFAWQWALQLQQLHSNTIRGDAILHLDIKGPNMMLHYSKNSKGKTGSQVNVQPFDFDLSQNAMIEGTRDINNRKITCPDQLRKVFLVGSPYHISPEMIKKEIAGARTDIYSAAPLIWVIFGADNPIGERSNPIGNKICTQYQNKIVNRADIPFDSNQLLNQEVLPDWLNKDYNQNIKIAIEKFIIRLGAQEYYDRPTTDEMLNFFTVFRKLNILYNNKVDGSDILLSESDDYIKDVQQYKQEIINLSKQEDFGFQLLCSNNSDELNKWKENPKNIGVLIYKLDDSHWMFIENKDGNISNETNIENEEMIAILNDIAKKNNTTKELLNSTKLTYDVKRIFNDIIKFKYVTNYTSDIFIENYNERPRYSVSVADDADGDWQVVSLTSSKPSIDIKKKL
tara:strand:- start:9307 stop:10896 length:1590 start_codon:yes stop_codon:yes gene_type:complete